MSPFNTFSLPTCGVASPRITQHPIEHLKATDRTGESTCANTPFFSRGQELGPDYVLDSLDSDNIHILLHEMGHGFGLLDFYDWVPQGQTSFVMMAGSAVEITEFDAWMLRDWYRKLKSVRGW